jgi:hypothetical protein
MRELAAGFRFVNWDELLLDAPAGTKRLKSPWRFAIDDDHHVVPDAIFSVVTPEDYHRLFFLEVDLSDHGEAVYRSKAKLYHDLIFKRIYKDQLGVEQWASVLTMTTNQSRLLTMGEVTPKRDPSVFKLAPQYSAIAKAPKPDPYILQGWIDPSNPTKPVSLIDILREEVN